jgi:AcrR family transcriptional regulator
MQRILDVSLELLDDVGVDGFNTNLLAERVGVAVRAIYRYFPNKLAILVALTESFREAERTWIGDLRAIGSGGDWRRDVDRAVDGYFNAAAGRRGYPALRAAALATPELREVERRGNKALEDDLAEGLRALGLCLDEARMAALCRTILEASTRVLDVALESRDPDAPLLVAELKRMLVGLLATYLD